MSHKLFVLVASLLLGAATLCAQVSPYEYHNRWYVSLQGGLCYFNGDCSYVYRKKGPWTGPFSLSGGAAVGYNIANGHEVRMVAAYGQKHATCVSFKSDLFPFTFYSASLFADYVLSLYPLAENFSSFNPKMYVGVGGAYTYGFTDPHHPFLVVSGPNWVGGLHTGSILEYDFPSGFGLFADIGLSFFADPYDGQGWYNFPVDMEIGLQFGMVYHFKRNRR